MPKMFSMMEETPCFVIPPTKFIFGNDLRLLNGILFGFLNNVLLLPREKGKGLFKAADCPFVISQINPN